jgi:hypothetical protein
LKKYFRVHDYSENLKAQITIFNLNGKASILWEDFRNVKGIHEKDLSWKQFEKYFNNKYLLKKNTLMGRPRSSMNSSWDNSP